MKATRCSSLQSRRSPRSASRARRADDAGQRGDAHRRPEFERGFPTEETKRKVFDEIDYQRAVQAYLWAYPAVSFESIRIATKRDLGADHNDMVIADNFADPKGLWLTANDTTIYGMHERRSRHGRAGRGRNTARSHRRNDRRLLAEIDHRRRPARPRRQAREANSSSCHPATRATFRRPATTSFKGR